MASSKGNSSGKGRARSSSKQGFGASNSKGARGKQTRDRNDSGKQYGSKGSSYKNAGYNKNSKGSPKGSDDFKGKPRRDSKPGGDVIIGRRAVLEAIESNVPLKSIMVASGSQQGEALDKIMELAEKLDIKLDEVSRKAIDEKAAGLNHQGVIAISKAFDYASIEEIIGAAKHSEASLVYVLDHINDAGNLGAIIRSAEILGASGVVIPNRRSVQVTSTTYKASAGAVTRVPIAQVSNISQACEKLKKSGYWVVGSSEKADESCWDSKMAGKTAIVMGNEGDGISRLVLETCDSLVRLPQRGEIGSLNVSCAAVSMGYEWLRQSVEAKLIELD